MATKGSIERMNMLKRKVEQNKEKRESLKKIAHDVTKSFQERFEAQSKLDKMCKFSIGVRVKNICSQTGNTRAYMRRFGISRIIFRQRAMEGFLPGVKKASW